MHSSPDLWKMFFAKFNGLPLFFITNCNNLFPLTRHNVDWLTLRNRSEFCQESNKAKLFLKRHEDRAHLYRIYDSGVIRGIDLKAEELDNLLEEHRLILQLFARSKTADSQEILQASLENSINSYKKAKEDYERFK